LIPGIDGEKMSKSRGNHIDIFLPEKQLRKQIMSIISDSIPLEEPKNPDTCHTFSLFALLASETEVNEMRKNYLSGNYGYGHAKQALFDLILNKFSEERRTFDELMANKREIDDILDIGSKKARAVATEVLKRVRMKLGY
jgi:tryptophanyl-tRNA synthetase